MSVHAMKAARATIWEAMVARAEALHEAVVRSQRRASPAAAKSIEAQAADLAALARTAAALNHPSGGGS